MVLYHLDWTIANNEPKLRRFLTDEAGKRLDPVLEALPFPPYFFSYADAAYKVFPPSAFEQTGIVIGGRPIVKFLATSPDVIPLARDAIGVTETFEADVPYGRRVLIETGESLSMPKRYVHVDIETDPTGGIPNIELADRKILSISAKASDGEERFFCSSAEGDTVGEFLQYFTEFPIWCTFNGNNFDEPYLKNRCRRLGITYDWWNQIHIDLLAVFKFVFQERLDQYSLASIAKYLGLKTQKRSIDINRLVEYYNSFLDSQDQTLKDYNLDDVRICDEMDQKMAMVATVFNIAAISHTTVKDLLRVHEKSKKEFNVSIAVDGLILYLSSLRRPRIIWKTKEHREMSEEEEEARRKKFAGAYVVPPKPGVHKNVALLDVNALYPTLIRMLNIGPETYIADPPIGWGASPGEFIKSPVGRGYFLKEPQSVFAEAITFVSEMRAEYKKMLKATNPALPEWKTAYAKDYAYKVLGLSFYGVLGSDFSRYYQKDVAENVTLTGQAVIKFLESTLERGGMTVVLGDTDSVAFTMPDLSLEMATKLAERFTIETQAYLQNLSGVSADLLRLDIDKLCSALYIQPDEKGEKGTKKRYAAFVVWQGVPTFKLLTKGFQTVRHDSSQAQKDFQTQGFMLLLSDASKEQEQVFVTDWKRRLYAGDLDEMIVLHKGLGRDPSEYKTERIVTVEEDDHTVVEKKVKVTLPVYVRVGLRLQEEGKIALYRGAKIAYIKTGPGLDDVVAVLPDGEKPSFTREQYAFIWDNQFLRIAQRLGIDTQKEYRPAPKPRKGKQAML